MAELSFDGWKFRPEANSPEKDNYERLLSVFHTGTDAKRCLLDFYLRDKTINLLDYLTNINKHFLQFEDVKKARRRSSSLTPTDLGLNTIDTVLKYNCFDMFWRCCLLNTCFEDILNKHKEELYRNYLNSSRQHDLHASFLDLRCTKEQWELLYERKECMEIDQEENESIISARKGITVSCLDSNMNSLVLDIVCPLYKAVNSISECQIRISKTAVLEYDMHIQNSVFDDIWNKMERNILCIGKHCQLYEHFMSCCERIKCTRFNKTLVQDNRKFILEEAFNNPAFIDDAIFCDAVQTELDHFAFEENLNLTKRLCEKDICINLPEGQYSKGAFTECVLENAVKDLQLRKSVCSTQEHRRHQGDLDNSIESDDIQKRCEKHNFLKVVQLLTDIGKDALVDALKFRLPAADFGQAFNGMKKRILPLLNNSERQLLYPDSSKYSGDLTDLDVSLLYIILRNVSTIRPHTKGWGLNPEDGDESLSANIDRIRLFKNKYVSHCANCSLNDTEFPNIWKDISKCIIQIGGPEYTQRTDFLLTLEINPVMENELYTALQKMTELEKENERLNSRLKENVMSIKQGITMMSSETPGKVRAYTRLVNVPMNVRLAGENIPSVSDIKPEDFTNDDYRVTSVEEGSIIIGLDVSPSALKSVGYFLKVIDTLISKLLQRCSTPVIDRDTLLIISIEFLGFTTYTQTKLHNSELHQNLQGVKRPRKRIEKKEEHGKTDFEINNFSSSRMLKPRLKRCRKIMKIKRNGHKLLPVRIIERFKKLPHQRETRKLTFVQTWRRF